jgi:hypothetical protein
VLLPAFAGLALLFGLGAGAAREPGALRGLLRLACLIQLAALLYNPQKLIPDAEDARAGDRLVARIRRIEGPVLIPAHGYLALRAGKRSAAHQMAINDIVRSRAEGVKRRLDRRLVHVLRGRRYAAVLTDGPWYAAELERGYTRQAVFEDPAVFTPVAGVKTRPSVLWVRRGK